MTLRAGFGSVRAMTATDADEVPGTQRRKHRHDLGHEDHGAKLAAGTTRAIQILLGLWVALSLALVVYVLIDGGRHHDAPTAGASAVPDRSR